MTTDPEPLTIRCAMCCGTGRRRISRVLRDVLEILVAGLWLSIKEIGARFRGRFNRTLGASALCNRLRRLADEDLVETTELRTRKRGKKPLLWRPKAAA